ncbi:MAG: sensor histidine kinase [Phycisphaerales bacterium]
MTLAANVVDWTRRSMARGESFATALGFGALLVMMCVLSGAAWWTLHTHGATQEQDRRDRLQMVAGLLSGSAESLLTAGGETELSSLRRMVAEASLNYGLSRCRVVLPDNQVLADASPRAITITRLPATWPKAAPGGSEPVQPDEISVPIRVPGRGNATLQIALGERAAFSSAWEMMAGIGAISAFGLIGLGLLHRLASARLRVLGAIREALDAAEKGEQAASALAVSSALGPSANTWNALLSERDQMREKMLAGKAIEKLATRSRNDADLASACDAMWHGLVLVDPSLTVRYANGAAAVFLGQKREDMNGKTIDSILQAPAALEAIRGIIAGKIRGKQIVEIKSDRTATPPKPDGEGDRRGAGTRPSWGGGVLRLSIRPVRRDDSAAAMILVEDVTQQRVADEARNAFVAQATHELRTPLTNMRLYIEQLQEDTVKDPAERAKAINVVSQESRRLERIVGDMLSVAEIEAGSLRLNTGDVRLATIFTELQNDFEKLAHDKEIALKFDLPPKFPVMRGDRDKIVLAAHNLIGNAIKYTPVGGHVTVRVEEGHGQLTMEVIDNGIGVREDEHEKIFERFYRAQDKRVGGITGSGLGLALAREVVRMHGGDIIIRSQLDKGSTFVMTLPIAAAPAAGARRQAA